MAKRPPSSGTIQGLVLALLRRVGIGTVAQFVGKGVEIQFLQQLVDSLGTHLGNELIGVGVLKIIVILRQLIVENIVILVLGEQVVLARTQQRLALGIGAAL